MPGTVGTFRTSAEAVQRYFDEVVDPLSYYEAKYGTDDVYYDSDDDAPAPVSAPLDVALMACKSRHDLIRDTFNQYMEMNGGVIDAGARASFSELLLNNTRELFAPAAAPP